MRTTKIVALACTALVLVSGLACGKTEDTTSPANNGGVIAESKSSSGGSTTTKASSKKTTTTGDPSGSTDSTTETTKKKATTTTGSGDDATIPDVSIPGGLPGNLDECLKAATAIGNIAASVGKFMQPGTTQADIDKLNDEIATVKKSVPDELKGDVEVWATAYAAYGKVLSEVMANGGYANPANLDKLQKANDIFENSGFKDANEHINAYFSKACK